MSEANTKAIEQVLADIHAELRVANAQKKTELLLQLLAQVENDSDVAAVYFEIEYGRFKYAPETFAETADEQRLDKLLRALNNVAVLHSRELWTTAIWSSSPIESFASLGTGACGSICSSWRARLGRAMRITRIERSHVSPNCSGRDLAWEAAC